MKMKNPFDWIAVQAQTVVFAAVLILTLALGVSLQALGSPLRTAEAPSGIVAFEFAGTLQKAEAIVASWGQAGKTFAGLNLGLDYLFLFSYAICIGLGCVLISRALSSRFRVLSSLGLVLAWAQIGAGLLDSLENYALIRVLLGTKLAYWPEVAHWCAIPKFLIIAAGILYVVLGAGLHFVGKRMARPAEAL
jgi:hypothetical protein